MARFMVLVDDNFHHRDPNERWELGTCETAEQPIAACRDCIDRTLKEQYRPGPGMTAAALYERHRRLADDPSILVLDGEHADAAFSARRCAEEHCQACCG